MNNTPGKESNGTEGAIITTTPIRTAKKESTVADYNPASASPLRSPKSDSANNISARTPEKPSTLADDPSAILFSTDTWPSPPCTPVKESKITDCPSAPPTPDMSTAIPVHGSSDVTERTFQDDHIPTTPKHTPEKFSGYILIPTEPPQMTARPSRTMYDPPRIMGSLSTAPLVTSLAAANSYSTVPDGKIAELHAENAEAAKDAAGKQSDHNRSNLRALETQLFVQQANLAIEEAEKKLVAKRKIDEAAWKKFKNEEEAASKAAAAKKAAKNALERIRQYQSTHHGKKNGPINLSPAKPSKPPSVPTMSPPVKKATAKAATQFSARGASEATSLNTSHGPDLVDLALLNPGTNQHVLWMGLRLEHVVMMAGTGNTEMVTRVADGSPAFVAGVRVGDVIAFVRVFTNCAGVTVFFCVYFCSVHLIICNQQRLTHPYCNTSQQHLSYTVHASPPSFFSFLKRCAIATNNTSQ
jgi:hypothetical protein